MKQKTTNALLDAAVYMLELLKDGCNDADDFNERYKKEIVAVNDAIKEEA